MPWPMAQRARAADLDRLLDDLEGRQNEAGNPMKFRPHLAAAE